MSRLAEQPSSPVIKFQPNYDPDPAKQLLLSKESLPTLHSPPKPPKESKKQYTIRFLFTMLLAILFTYLIGTHALRTPASTPTLRSRDSVDEYAAKEGPIALQGLLANIGTKGSKSSGAHQGVVIASPSTADPNYLYTWIRDSSLVFKVIIDRYVSGRDSDSAPLINDWVASMAKIQQVENRSGGVSTGGLGEPKFNIDETAFTGDWGRPQRDGPALRSTSIIRFANHLLAQGNETWVKQHLWPVLKLDLGYVADSWNLTGFDLWEEVSGSSFFTTAVQHRSLREGIALATALGDPDKTVTEWTIQADNALCFLQSYWSSERGYIVSNVDGGHVVRSGLDSNTVLGSVHTFDPAAGCDAATFQPCSDKALANLKVYVDSFRIGVYSINNGIPANEAIAIGRYFEDVYFNGNPWYLTTLAVAEQLYRAVYTWDAMGSGIEVTTISLPFFKQFLPSLTGPTTIAAGSHEYATVIDSIKTFANGFVAIVAKYTPADGGLSEQFTKDAGAPLSAVDLTWSYASALTAFDARADVPVDSWGADGLIVPTVCGTNPGPTSTLAFQVFAETIFGENVFVTGDMDVIGSWNPDKAIALSSADYPTWKGTVTVPANTRFQYKYIKKHGSNVIWESDPNRQATTPTKGQSGTLEDRWR